MNIKKSSFHPISNLDNKSNYKPYYRIERDGTIFERIFLDIPDKSIREQLICMHYFKNYSAMFYNEPMRGNVLSRDSPWDFKIELSTNEIFNVEITSIAEDSELFEKLQREERFISKSFEEKIPFRELEKLNRLFPNSDIDSQIKKLNESGISKGEMVANLYKGFNPNIFLSSKSYLKEPLENLIQKSVISKELKKHAEKNITALIIDNRTLTYEQTDLQTASNSLQHFFESSSFKEIWFYTGYCSDLDGKNSEFSFAPLKLTKAQNEILEKRKKENPPDKDGIIYY